MAGSNRTLNECLETVRTALDQPGDMPQRIIANELMRLGDLLIRKNSDYGCSAWFEPYMAPGVDARTAILVRMSDKVSRIHSLMKQNGTGLVDESLEDTIRDLQGYCLLWLACTPAAVKTL